MNLPFPQSMTGIRLAAAPCSTALRYYKVLCAFTGHHTHFFFCGRRTCGCAHTLNSLAYADTLTHARVPQCLERQRSGLIDISTVNVDLNFPAWWRGTATVNRPVSQSGYLVPAPLAFPVAEPQRRQFFFF